jgi:hypothetical protein
LYCKNNSIFSSIICSVLFFLQRNSKYFAVQDFNFNEVHVHPTHFRTF